jgi:hypothetical protein
MGYAEDFADGSGGDGKQTGKNLRENVPNLSTKWALLSNFTSNPAIPAKLNPTEGGLQRPFLVLFLVI